MDKGIGYCLSPMDIGYWLLILAIGCFKVWFLNFRFLFSRV
jgi:hypothetical protein